MPLYEYACAKCGEITEVIQKISDPAPAKCPSCGAKKLEKVISRSSFQLKGGGWYSEGYSSGSAAKTEAKADPAGKTDSAGKSDSTGKSDSAAKKDSSAKSESKPAPKAEPKPAAKSESKSATKKD